MNLLKYSLLAFLLGISVIAVSINDTQVKEADYVINESNEIEEIVFDGIYEKTHNITSDNMEKISGTIEKVMNDNSGLVCLIV